MVLRIAHNILMIFLTLAIVGKALEDSTSKHTYCQYPPYCTNHMPYGNADMKAGFDYLGSVSIFIKPDRFFLAFYPRRLIREPDAVPLLV